MSGSGSESADVTITLPDDVQIASDLTVAGNLTVNGTLTSLDTTNLDIEDNLFQLNAGLTGSPVNDSGMLLIEVIKIMVSLCGMNLLINSH